MFNKIFSNRKFGFYFTIFCSIVLLITGILFLSITPGLTQYTDFALKTVNKTVLNLVGILAIIGAFIPLVLMIFRWETATQYSLFGITLIVFMLFIYVSYRYVFEFMMDIEVHSLASGFIFLCIMFVVSLISSTANVFLKQTKEATNE